MIDSLKTTLVSLIEDPQTALWVLGILIAYYWYRRSIRVAAMRFQSRTISLLDANTRNMFSELEMKFDGRQVQSLKRTRLVIWNRGTAAVRSQEFAEHDQLRMVCEGGEILRCVVVKSSNKANNFVLPKYSPGAESLTPSFEYFDPKDGVQLEIWHTGDASKIVAAGSIVGAGKVSQTIPFAETAAYRKLPKQRPPKWYQIALTVACVVFIIWALGFNGLDHAFDNVKYGSPTWKLIDTSFKVIGYIIGGCFVIFFALLIGAMITLTSVRVPKALAIDFEPTQ